MRIRANKADIKTVFNKLIKVQFFPESITSIF